MPNRAGGGPKTAAATGLTEEGLLMVILAVDLGKARTGLAVCDKSGILASPAGVITEYNPEKLLEKVAEQARAYKAELLVMGLPRNMDGSEGRAPRMPGSLARPCRRKPACRWSSRMSGGRLLPPITISTPPTPGAKSARQWWTPWQL